MIFEFGGAPVSLARKIAAAKKEAEESEGGQKFLVGVHFSTSFLFAPPERKLSKVSVRIFVKKSSDFNQKALPIGKRKTKFEVYDIINLMCGVTGIFNHPKAANLAYLMLFAIQHRGQEGAGIVSSDGKNLFLKKGVGKVGNIFEEKEIKHFLCGNAAIGHNRYSTIGHSCLENVQPIEIKHLQDQIAVCHNGNLVNAHLLRKELENHGNIFKTTVDTEIILHLIIRSSKETFLEKLIEALGKIQGAYSILILTKEKLIAVRDPLGVKPLCLGRLNGAYVLASESCAFDLIGAKYQREIEPGEILVINKKGIKSYFLPHCQYKCQKKAQCIFEYIYFARPDSIIFGIPADSIRKQLGRELAKENLTTADLVCAVPDSSNAHTIGFSQESGIPFDQIFIRNHYIGRTFIEPEQRIRNFGVKLKLNPVPSCKGKRIIVIDDSIVRGTTSEKIVRMLFSKGAKEVHYRVASPPIKFPCYFGIDTHKGELIAKQLSLEKIRKKIGATTLSYLSLQGMYQAVEKFSLSAKDFCDSCFTGKYPMPIPKAIDKFCLEK